MGSGELIDYLFLHCLITLELDHKLFSLANRDWVLLKSICHMVTISFIGLRSSIRGKAL